MTTIAVGEHAKLIVDPSQRERLQRFYRDVLGCRVITQSPAMDRVECSNFSIGVLYDSGALTDAQVLKSIWLEICTEDPVATKAKILEFGIKPIEFWDKEHFYFQAPGGQVFRLVGLHETQL
jgi:catechol 2,3-dioxygenase-like lactoylglutathione lyase family enzyme